MKSRVCGMLVSNNRILLVKHRKSGDNYYVIPGGGVEAGESNEEGVVREFFEETGLVVKVEKLLFTRKGERMEYYYLVTSNDDKVPSHLGDPDLGKGVIQGVEWVELRKVEMLRL